MKSSASIPPSPSKPKECSSRSRRKAIKIAATSCFCATFVIFRPHREVFRREHLRRYGDDLLSEAIPLLLGKIDSGDLEYRDPAGRPKPVRFVS